MLSILKSLAITGTVAALFGILLWSIGYDPVKVIVFTFIGQLIFFYFFNTIIQSNISIKQTRLENERIAEFSKQGTTVPCAYCNTNNFIPIRFDVDNNFPCTSCEKVNSVYINITTTQVTTPMEATPLAVQAYIQSKEEAIEKLKFNE